MSGEVASSSILSLKVVVVVNGRSVMIDQSHVSRGTIRASWLSSAEVV